MNTNPEKRTEKGKRAEKGVLQNAFAWVLGLSRTVKILAAAVIAVAPLATWTIQWWRERPTPLQAPFDVNVVYKPGAFMGDGGTCADCIEINNAFAGRSRPGDSDGLCIRISYVKAADKGFAGIYWTWPDRNWGDLPGRRIVGASKMSFWAAGENGGEIVDFAAGGVRAGKRHSDSFTMNLDRRRLEREWRHYELDLRKADLSEVIGAFAWSAASNWNTMPLVFYLDDIRYE
jgi:hypothetical protein